MYRLLMSICFVVGVVYATNGVEKQPESGEPSSTAPTTTPTESATVSTGQATTPTEAATTPENVSSMLEQLKDEDSPAEKPTFLGSTFVLPNLETYSRFRNANWDLKQIFQTLEETPAPVYKEIDRAIKQLLPQVEGLSETNLIRKFIVNADTILRFFEYASHRDKFMKVISPTNQWLIELMKLVAPDFLRIIEEMAGTAQSLGQDVRRATGPASPEKPKETEDVAETIVHHGEGKITQATQTEASSSLPGLVTKPEEIEKSAGGKTDSTKE